jgi:acyl dehydratase
MTEQQKVKYSQLEVGYEFPPASFELTTESVSAYLKATGETDSLYNGTGIVPPTAVAAWALVSLLDYIDLPFGTIHLSQEIQFIGTANAGDTITCHAKVSRKKERGQLKLLNIDIKVVNQNDKPVLAGKSAFTLP